jgi:hypothetical protein
LAPSDYYLFPNFRKHFKGGKFSFIEEFTLDEDVWFATQSSEFFLARLKTLQQQRHKCVGLEGGYVE